MVGLPAQQADRGDDWRVLWVLLSLLCKPSKNRGITISQWEAELGSDQARLDDHYLTVQEMINEFKKKGCNRRAHISWEAVDKTVLKRKEIQQIKVRHPGWDHMGYTTYVSKHGDPATNGKGHTRAIFKGVDGVWIPCEDVRHVDFNEIMQAEKNRSTCAKFDPDGEEGKPGEKDKDGNEGK